jgi:hypothetical protein
MYTFNAYETGVLWDEDGNIDQDHFDTNTAVGQRTSVRIDNVNGFINIGAVDPSTITKDDCLDKLASIHSELMHNKSNANILSKVASILGIRDANVLSSIEYGIKSSAMVSNNAPEGTVYGTADNYT